MLQKYLCFASSGAGQIIWQIFVHFNLTDLSRKYRFSFLWFCDSSEISLDHVTIFFKIIIPFPFAGDADSDGDGIKDSADDDDDNDGLLDTEDIDDDGDGIKDEDEDHDGDGLSNKSRICFMAMFCQVTK